MEKERIKLQVVSLAVILLLSISLILAIIPFTASASPSTTSIEVEKWVKYKGEPDTEYRKKIDDAKVCDTVTFKIAIQNDGSTPLTDIWIWDSLDCDLEYIEGSASETPTLYANWCPEYQEFQWEFPDLWLDPGEFLNITFDAHIVESGDDINEVYVYAEDDATGWDEDEDTVEVNIPAQCVETATGSGIACFNTNAGTMEDLKAVAESTLPSEGKPDLAFIHGLFSFNITELTAKQTVEVTITLPINVPVGTQYWGYGPTPDNLTPHWYQIPMGSDDGDDVITITITDGYKIGDNDLSANGEIAALGGPGVSKVPMLDIKKSCKSSTVSLGGTVTYTIKYSNPGGVDLTNVVITENYPDGLTFISAVPDPDPGTNNKWTIGTLTAGESGKITIKMKVPDSTSDLSYTESGSVSGEGIVMISKELSTKVKPFDLENIVTISGSYGETNVSATASAITTVSASGSSLEITEHGSGTYESEEELSVSSKNMRINFDKYTNAEYSPTIFKCSDGFVMEVPSKWSQDICTKSYAKNSAIHKKISGATYLRDLTTGKVDNNVCTMYIGSSFVGYLHVDRKTKDAATSEHYIGDFDVEWELGEERVKGVGYVIVDKELSSGRLLLMEHGSGYYLSEEDSDSSKIEKTLYAEYEPTSFNFSDGFVVNFSSKWMQDFCTRSKTGSSALHKKIRDATYIDDDTTAKSSPSLKFDTFFYGATHVGSRSRYSKASEDYIGKFYISWAAITACLFVFDWDDVPGADEAKLIMHLSEPRFHMPWVTDDDVEITKPANDTIVIFTPEHEHSAQIILDTETNETAKLIVDGVDTYTFDVKKDNDKLKVRDCLLERKPEEVIGEGFVMVDEAIFRDGEIEVTEHGSGIYRSHEDFGSKTIEKETYGEYKPTYFEFSDSFSVNFSSKWMQDVCAKDEDEGTAIHKKISDASFMKDDTIAAKSLMNITSSFNGSMHIGARAENVSISEDYIGEFNVTQLIKSVKGKPPKPSSESSDWLSCPYPIPKSTYQWIGQDPTSTHHWICPSIAP